MSERTVFRPGKCSIGLVLVASTALACDRVPTAPDTGAPLAPGAAAASNGPERPGNEGAAGGATSRVQAGQDTFPVTSVHVAWLAQPAPEILPSGNARFEGWEHLWYDDAADDRLDGYDTVVIDGMFDPHGGLVYAHGTFVVREKLDDYQFADFLDGTFDLNQVAQGQTLFEGRFALTPQRPRDSAGFEAVAMNAEGLKAYYFFPDPFEFPVLHSRARIVAPHGQ
jgi:hypothetical protein